MILKLLLVKTGIIRKQTNYKIVTGCKKGNPESRKLLYDKYASQMYSVCMRYAKNTDDANDIFQQAFYLVYKNIGQLKNENALSGWIKSIFVNTALEHLKKKARTVMAEPIEHYFDDNATDNWNNALSSLAIGELTKLIQELPARCQLVFNLYAIEGFTHKEIAKKLNISVGTSKSQLHDARKILKNKVLANSIIRTTKY